MQIKNYTFESQPVLMDFHDFRGCTFRKCRLVYCGFGAIQFDGCRFEDCHWDFSGPAGATLHVLSTFNHLVGEMGRMIVQQALAIINNPPPKGPAPGAGLPGAPVMPPPPAGFQPPMPPVPSVPPIPPATPPAKE
jgi:hypothetical protein